jgi:FMN phosphatase YigB (HAD superfamily)
MRRTLDALGLVSCLDAVAISSEVGVRKPHPAIYEGVLLALDVRPEEAVFVGDRVSEDVIGPQSVGMRAILSHEYRQEPPDGARPDAILGSFAELPAALDQLQAAPHRPDAELPA